MHLFSFLLGTEMFCIFALTLQMFFLTQKRHLPTQDFFFFLLFTVSGTKLTKKALSILCNNESFLFSFRTPWFYFWLSRNKLTEILKKNLRIVHLQEAVRRLQNQKCFELMKFFLVWHSWSIYYMLEVERCDEDFLSEKEMTI